MTVEEINVERGGFFIGWKTAGSVVIGILIAAVGGVISWGQLATKAEQSLLAETFGLQIAKAQATAETADERASANSVRITKFDRLDGRIEFLVEAQLEAARASKRTHKAVTTAMRRVRARAKARGKPDPIPDVQF